MRVLALCSYPVEAAATRYRLAQFQAPLAARGIELEIAPFFDRAGFEALYRGGSAASKLARIAKMLLRRVGELRRARRFDVLLVQREAMIFGPELFERLFQTLGGLPLVLDLDDATYIAYKSPTYGRLGSWLKFFGKTDRLISRSAAVICGNRFIAEYVESKGTKAVVIPTVVDTDEFRPDEARANAKPTLGWIGTHSTFPFLESIFPALESLAKTRDFRLKVVGAGRGDVAVPGVEIENLDWSLARETADFRSLDIGLYPLELGGDIPREWIAGKSGFKAIQYMSVGIPFVMTPVGVCAEIGVEGETHFAATTLAEWESRLSLLLDDPTIRQNFGRSGREHALRHYTVDAQVERLESVLNEAAAS